MNLQKFWVTFIWGIVLGTLVVCLCISVFIKTRNINVQDTTPATEIPPKTTNELLNDTEISIEEFINQTQGHWAIPGENSCTVISLSNNSFESCVYPGSFDRPGSFTKIIKKTDGTYEATIYYPETIMFEGEKPKPEIYETLLFSSNDNYNQTLTVTNSNGNKFNYTFIGKSEEEWRSKCDKLLQQKAVANTSLYSYVGKPAQKVFEDYGYDYFINPMNKGMGFIYDEGVWFKYLNYIDFNLQPTNYSIVLEIMTDSKGIDVYNGVKIGDSFNKLHKIDWYDGNMLAKTYVEDTVITWTIDFINKTIISATIVSLQ